MSEAFGRARIMMAAIAAAMALATRGAQQEALREVGPYKSRGKGRGTPSRRYGLKAGKYEPHQGKSEMARRAARMASAKGAK